MSTQISKLSSGGVTTVTGTAPVVSSGGLTPAISMPAATNSVSGYLTSTDRTTFNAKQAALVSGTNIKSINSTSLLSGGNLVIPQSGHMVYGTTGYQYSNTINGATLASGTWSTVAGTLGLTPFTPTISFTTSSFSVLVTAYGTNLIGGNIVIYANAFASQTIGGLINKQNQYTLNISASGIATVTASFTFTAGITYWIGWMPYTLLGTASIMSTYDPKTMNTINSPIGTVQNIGYLATGLTGGSIAPSYFTLSSYTLTNSNITQVWFAI